ncbi:hypothetical protein [Streptomyces sp. NPDC059639]|uniref:hypothetical protein n=1 Tax=Streptomyces sp. NPDC059639 TaxID=3346891 RepID=UPI00369F0381
MSLISTLALDDAVLLVDGVKLRLVRSDRSAVSATGPDSSPQNSDASRGSWPPSV